MKPLCQEIRARLLSMQDEAYAAFQRRLMPTVDPTRVIGVRTPLLRRYAKELAGTEVAEVFLASLPHLYYEENNLHAALLERLSGYDRTLAAVEQFLPYLDNWATCDMLSPKALQKEPARFYTAIKEYLTSGKVYTVRFGLVRLTNWYLDAPHFSPEILEAAAAVTHADYYVRMAQAWFFSIALIKQFESTLPYLTAHRLDPWTHNKAIQKAIESYRVPTETKALLRTLKRSLKKEETP